MKKLLFLAVLSGLGYLTYVIIEEEMNRPSTLCERPPEFPEWIEWNCEAQRAYENGTLYINADSTAIAYPTNTKIDKDNAAYVSLPNQKQL